MRLTRLLTALLPIAVVLAVAGPAGAAGSDGKVVSSSLLSPCFSTHTAGTGLPGDGNASVSWCVTPNGNVESFQSPIGVQNMGSDGGEGYLICDHTGSHGHDLGNYGSAGFKPATATQPNGANTFPLTISRTTTDGIYRFTQKFTMDAAGRGLVIAQTLRNLSEDERTFVSLDRQADIDVGGTSGDDIFMATHDAVIGFGSGVPASRGVMLGMAPNSLLAPHATYALGFQIWNSGLAKTSCGPDGSKTPTAVGDHVARLRAGYDALLPGQVKTVSIRYATL